MTTLAIILGLAVIALLILEFVQQAKFKKSGMAILVDPVTQMSNHNYYLLAFNDLENHKVLDQYACAYIAFDYLKYESALGKTVCHEIERIIAQVLSHNTTPNEYAANIRRGVFVLLFKAKDEAECRERSIDGVNAICHALAQRDPHWENMINAGVCMIGEHPGITAEESILNAKQGCTYATSRHMLYYITSSRRLDQNTERNMLFMQIDDALKNNEFKPYVQFMYDGKSDAICGGEVLSRWHHPQHGILNPIEYIGLLRESGKIVEHDYVIFEAVCRQLEAWKDTEYAGLFLTCNFTRLSVCNINFADTIREISQRYDFPHSNLVIEITEDTLSMDTAIQSNNINQIHEQGFLIAFDDMGAGFTSLSDVYDNEIEVVKIERDFLISCNTLRRRQMLKDLVSMIHNAGAYVVTEGVETEEQQQMLKSIDCNIMQGFLHCRVIPLLQGEEFLGKNKFNASNILLAGR